jgi:hypothetical protein
VEAVALVDAKAAKRGKEVVAALSSLKKGLSALPGKRGREEADVGGKKGKKKARVEEEEGGLEEITGGAEEEEEEEE